MNWTKHMGVMVLERGEKLTFNYSATMRAIGDIQHMWVPSLIMNLGAKIEILGMYHLMGN